MCELKTAFVASLCFGFLVAASGYLRGGCNGNGLDDAVDIAGGVSEDCDGNGIPDECDVAPLFFTERQDPLVVRRFGIVVASGDLDGDGNVDIVVGSRAINRTSSVAVYPGSEEDGFAAAVEFPAGEGLAALSLVDLDADGDLDVALAATTAVATLENTTASDDGLRLESPVSHAVEGEVRAIAVGELTGDALPELVTLDPNGGTATILVNDRDAAFVRAVVLSVGGRPTAVSVGDFDGDRDADLAVALAEQGLVTLANRGAGSFALPKPHETGRTRPFSVITGAFGGDDGVDLAVADSRGVAVLLGDGNADFRPPRAFELPGTPNALQVADVEGDGTLDFAVGFGNADDVAVLLTDGSPELRVTVRRQGDLPRGVGMLVSDLDGDEDAEIGVLTVNRLRLVWNVDESEAGLPFRGERFRVDGEPHTATIGDLNGDDALDVITGNNLEGVSVMLNRGDGTFALPDRIPIPGSAFSIVASDFDVDGVLDIATSDLPGGVVRVLINHGDGTFSPFTEYRCGSQPFHVTAGDLDRDGDADIVASNSSVNTISVVPNRGDGTFDEPRPASVGGGPMAAAMADLDGDGSLDLAVANAGSSSVSILGGTGSLDLGEREDVPLVGAPSFVIAADLDGDDRPDLATANEADSSVSVLWNAARVGATLGDLYRDSDRFDVGQAPFSLLSADTDGDRRLDLLTSNLRDNTISLLLNRGGRSLEVTPPIDVGGEPRFSLAGDLDRDGDVDFISANHADRDMLVLFNLSSSFDGDFLERICTEADLYKISLPSRRGAVKRIGKFIAPATEDPTLLPVLFQDVRRFLLHEEFLIQVFPERFGDLDVQTYDGLVGRRATRKYYVGTISHVRTSAGAAYAFTAVADTGFDEREVLGLEEIASLHETLSEAFTLRPFGYAPETRVAQEEAATWVAPSFPIITFDEGPRLEYEAYTRAVGYGRVRVVTLEEFLAANSRGRFTFQDIVVIDQAPQDIEGIVGGVITGERQGELSHVAIRTARRGTPNAFVDDAIDVFAPYDGKLIRLEVLEGEYLVTEPMLEEAEEFWASQRRELASPPTLDAEYSRLDRLLEMDLVGADGVSPVARYGGKATNLARLQRLLTGEFERYRLDGFAIPIHYYVAFMNSNRLTVDGVERTYQEHLDALLSSDEFNSNSEARFQALEEFREFVRDAGVVDPEVIAALVRRVDEVFGSRTRMVRFRSSSNVEDALEFNGAGLYESTSVCVADTLDDDEDGPSLCDPAQRRERTIERALKKVWASLWTFRAHEERTFFQIDPQLTAMGILVNRAFLDEVTNGVAFTGSPSDPRERRYVITAQIGEESVVSPEPGTTVERTLLEVSELDGAVVDIARARGSSLVEPGSVVMSDEHLVELARLMWHVDGQFPLELGEYEREQVLLDFEFKVEPDGSLAVKQVRPFLLAEPPPPAPTLSLEIPAGVEVCGVFSKERTGRSAQTEYETKSTVTLRAQTLELPVNASTFEADLIEVVRFGDPGNVGEAEGPGRFRSLRVPVNDGGILYRFQYEQAFRLSNGSLLELEIFRLDFRTDAVTPTEAVLVLDEAYLTFELQMQAALDGTPLTSYSSCTYELLPRWEVDVALEGGSSIHLVERFLPSPNMVSTGPSSLVSARLDLGGAVREIDDYWHLVYAARRHNLDVTYWIELVPPLKIEGLESAVRVVEVIAPEVVFRPREAEVRYLDTEFEELARQSPASYAHEEKVAAGFRRGDVDADGSLTVRDVLSLLGYLFQRGPAPGCLDSADANDDERLAITDAVVLAQHIFGGRTPLPAPEICGLDPAGTSLSCDNPRCEE